MASLKHSGATYQRRAAEQLRKAAKNLDRARRQFAKDQDRKRYAAVMRAEKKVAEARSEPGF